MENLSLSVACGQHRKARILGYARCDCISVQMLISLDSTPWYLQMLVEVAIDARRTNRQRREVGQSTITHDGDIGQISSQIDNHHALLSLVRRKKHLGQQGRVDAEALDTHSSTIECLVDHINLLFANHRQQIGSREFVTIAADRILHLLHIVESVAKRYALHNLVATCRCHQLDALMQLAHLALADTICRIGHIDIILVAHTIHRLARHAHIGRIESNAKLLLEILLCCRDGLTQLEIVEDISILDTRSHILRLDSDDRNRTLATQTYS